MVYLLRRMDIGFRNDSMEIKEIFSNNRTWKKKKKKLIHDFVLRNCVIYTITRADSFIKKSR